MTEIIPLQKKMKSLYTHADDYFDSTADDFDWKKTRGIAGKAVKKGWKYIKNKKDNILQDYIGIRQAVEDTLFGNPYAQIVEVPAYELKKRNTLAMNKDGYIFKARKQEIPDLLGRHSFRYIVSRISDIFGLRGRKAEEAALEGTDKAIDAHEAADDYHMHANGLRHMSDDDAEHGKSNAASIYALKDLHPPAYVSAMAMQELRSDALGRNTERYLNKLREAA